MGEVWAPAKARGQAAAGARTGKPWDIRSLAFFGVFFGLVVGTALVMSEAFWRELDGTEPFYPCVLKIMGYTVVGAQVFAAVAWVHNRIIRA